MCIPRWGGVVELNWADRYWSYTNTTGYSINIPYGNINTTYINQSYPFLVNNSSSNGLNIPKDATIKLNIIEPNWNTDPVTMNINRFDHSCVGNINSCMVQGGSASASILTTETYDGSVWANNNNLNAQRQSHCATGIANNCIVVGGMSNDFAIGTIDDSEIYNGTIWTLNSAKLNNARRESSIIGTSINCMIQCGNNYEKWISSTLNTTESYNGSVWAVNSSANIIRQCHSAIGNINSCMIQGGYSDFREEYIAFTEIFNGSIWINSDLINQKRSNHTACGNSYNYCTIVGGNEYRSNSNAWYPISNSETYNGNSWNTNRAYIKIDSHSSTKASGACMVQGGSSNPDGLNTTKTCYWPEDDNFTIGKIYIPG